MYKKLISLGIYGAKLLGAGQGGFLLLASNKDVQKKIKSNLGSKNFIKVRFDNDGAKLVYRSENLIK